jgi:hypothetical protein
MFMIFSIFLKIMIKYHNKKFKFKKKNHGYGPYKLAW